MSDVIKFFKELNIELDPDDLRELEEVSPSEAEVERAREFLTDLGFDLQSFATEGNHWIVRLFGKPFDERDKIREAAITIQRTFRSPSPFNNLIKLLYAIGFSLRDIVFTLYRLGFKGIPLRTVQTHINQNQFEFTRERLKFMELIDCAKSSVFQELAAEVKVTETRSAKIYLKHIEIIQEALDQVDPIIETVKFNRYIKQIEMLQAKLNAMHGIDDMRKATVDSAAKIAVLKAAKEMEKDTPQAGDETLPGKGKILEAEEVSPFSHSDNNNNSIARKLAS